MKKILFIMMAFMIPLWAESLTILNKEKDSDVYINGVRVGQGAIIQHPLDSGDYIIEIRRGEDTLFKESITIYVGENKVLDTAVFVGVPNSSTIVDYGAKQAEEKRIRRATRGNVGVGFGYGTIASGASIKFMPFSRVGIQAIGWASNNSDSDKYNTLGRVVYEFEETLIARNQLAVVYMGLGLGKSNESFDTPSIGNINQLKSKDKTFTEGFIGVDFLMKSNFYLNLEVSIIYKEEKDTTVADVAATEDNGFETGVSIGAHFYFN